MAVVRAARADGFYCNGASNLLYLIDSECQTIGFKYYVQGFRLTRLAVDWFELRSDYDNAK